MDPNLTDEQAQEMAGQRDWRPGEEAEFDEAVKERLDEVLASACHDFDDNILWDALQETGALSWIRMCLIGPLSEAIDPIEAGEKLLRHHLQPIAEEWVRTNWRT